MLDKRFRGLHNFPGGVKYGKLKFGLNKFSNMLGLHYVRTEKGEKQKEKKRVRDNRTCQFQFFCFLFFCFRNPILKKVQHCRKLI